MAPLRPSDLPDIPAGSAITIEETPDGLRLQWRNPRGGLGRYALAVFLFCWLGGWCFGVVFGLGLLIRMALEGWAGLSLFVLCWLGIWLVGGVLVLRILVRLVGRGRPESLLLGEYDFHHRAGTPPLVSLSMHAKEVSRFWNSFRRSKETVAEKDVVGNPLLERVGEHQGLTVDVGADHIEIGEYLREPEREWLAQVLQRWFAEG